MSIFDFFLKRKERKPSLEQRVQTLEKLLFDVVKQSETLGNLSLQTAQELEQVIHYLKVEEQKKISPLSKKTEYYN